ncbi:helicase associated domain-containing protein [Rhodococcus opacus]|uniref:helicase associated domain-containing protein n=1 Tax=Rhodococcus opacus TaxID=37919 RepID=UPI002474C0BC|nr:helicase associated domain-containing protein [Rhodococcus opacus]MDH6291923.1 hypothetical protein [Rhodococcus opacus]
MSEHEMPSGRVDSHVVPPAGPSAESLVWPDDRWENRFGRLLEYVEHYGHARVPASYTVDDCRLGSWVQTQRQSHAKGALDPGRERRLQKVPGWTWDPIADRWEAGFGRLLEFIEHHGSARVPASYTVEGYRLGSWVHTQRTFHVKGRLDAGRERRLQDLPGWTWGPVVDRWEEGFGRLLEFIELYGHARVPQSHTVDGYRLGLWVHTQRVQHLKGAVDADHERRLQDLPGWTWAARLARWEDGFDRLRNYVELHGHARVPKSYTVDGYRLGKWVDKQRGRRSAGTLDSDRERRLEELPGWKWTVSASA